MSALRQSSREFCREWTRHNVARSGAGRKEIRHPIVGHARVRTRDVQSHRRPRAAAGAVHDAPRGADAGEDGRAARGDRDARRLPAAGMTGRTRGRSDRDSRQVDGPAGREQRRPGPRRHGAEAVRRSGGPRGDPARAQAGCDGGGRSRDVPASRAPRRGAHAQGERERGVADVDGGGRARRGRKPDYRASSATRARRT